MEKTVSICKNVSSYTLMFSTPMIYGGCVFVPELLPHEVSVTFETWNRIKIETFTTN